MLIQQYFLALAWTWIQFHISPFISSLRSKDSPFFHPASSYLVKDNPYEDFCNSEGYLEKQMQVLRVSSSAEMTLMFF